MGDTHPRAFVFFSLTHLDKKSDWHFSEEHREQISIILYCPHSARRKHVAWFVYGTVDRSTEDQRCLQI